MPKPSSSSSSSKERKEEEGEEEGQEAAPPEAKRAKKSDVDAGSEDSDDDEEEVGVDEDEDAGNVEDFDLTRDAIEKFFDRDAMTDRRRLSWALNTETRVRLAKVGARNNKGSADRFRIAQPPASTSTSAADAAGEDARKAFGETFKSLKGTSSSGTATSHTLDSNYLFEVYPRGEADGGDGEKKKKAAPTEGLKKKVSPASLEVAKDFDDFSRRRHPAFDEERPPDQSLRDLPSPRNLRATPARSALEEPESPGATKAEDPMYSRAPVPPNLLFARIVLEAYTGYKWPRFHYDDPTVPRCAIMGGAVVAALTSWRDRKVRKTFAKSGLVDTLQKFLQKKTIHYKPIKDRLIRKLNLYFLHSSSVKSPFATGDVDVFVQCSPFWRDLRTEFSKRRLSPEIQARILSFCTGQDHSDSVQCMDLQRLASKIDIASTFNTIPDFSFVYAQTRNALSFMLTSDVNPEDADLSEMKMWPRNTQMIKLSDDADLLGGLLDFDISLVSCAYDGIDFRVTPRAAFSLVTQTQVVTPFIMEEKRNMQRIKKYSDRGFPCVILDPNCIHDRQCCVPTFQQNQTQAQPQSAAARQRHDQSFVEELTQYQSDHGFLGRKDGCIGCDGGYYFYSIVLIEHSPGDAINFFALKNKWTTDKRKEKEDIDPRMKCLCRKCRYEYENYAFFRENPNRKEPAEDPLRSGEMFSRSHNHVFAPCFYSGGVFDSKRVMGNAHFRPMALNALESQLTAEKWKYFNRESSFEGYKPRYVFGDDLDEVFTKLSETELQRNSRAPIGLNPERFVVACKSCNYWLLGYECGEKHCSKCQPKKPAPSAEEGA